MGCRRMLGVEDRAAIMAGLEAGLSQVCIAHLIGRSPSVVCREIARHTGPDGQYRAEEAGKAARAARRRPKKRLLDCDEVLRRRVLAGGFLRIHLREGKQMPCSMSVFLGWA